MEAQSELPALPLAVGVSTGVQEITEKHAVSPETHLDSQRGAASSSKRLKKNDEARESLDDILLRRITTIKEGDNVLLRLPSDSIKAVVASKDGLV